MQPHQTGQSADPEQVDRLGDAACPLGSSEPYPFHVLLRAPESLNIPLFALGVEKGRPAVEQHIVTDPAALQQVLNGNTARALQTGRYGAYRVVRYRYRTRLRTALHSTWLALADAKQAQVFQHDFPRLGVDAISRQIETALRKTEAQLRDGLSAGEFDLANLHVNARLKRARKYVSLSEKMETLRFNQHAVRVLRQVTKPGPDVV